MPVDEVPLMGPRSWSRVNPSLNMPLNGLYLSTAVCCLLGLIYFGRCVDVLRINEDSNGQPVLPPLTRLRG